MAWPAADADDGVNLKHAAASDAQQLRAEQFDWWWSIGWDKQAFAEPPNRKHGAGECGARREPRERRVAT